MTVNNPSSAGQNNYGISGRDYSDWQEYRGESYRQYRAQWAERPRRAEPGEFPLHVDIETTNVCNLKCIMCPRTKFIKARDKSWSPQGLGYMPRDIYERIIKEAADGGAYSVKLNLLGEPLMHPEVIEHVRLARANGLYVMLNTNATLLDEKTGLGLINAGVDDVFFSVDSPDKDCFERIRPGADFDLVIGNIKRFVELKEKSGINGVRTRASMTTDIEGPTGREELEKFKKIMLSLGVDEIGYGPEDDHLGDHSQENMEMCQASTFICEQIYQRMFVTWDGVLTPCCGHWGREYIIGSINETSLKKAWRNGPYRKMREAHEQGRFQDISICRRCSVPKSVINEQ